MADLITTAVAKDLLKIDDSELLIDCLELYQSGTAGIISATVEVTATQLVVTDNVTGATSLTLATYSTVTLLIAALVTAKPLWFVDILLLPGADPVDLPKMSSADAFLEANTVTVQIVNNWLIGELIDGVSTLAERLCYRTFSATDYLEQIDGSNDERLLLEQFPIISVYWVATSTTNGLRVTNESAVASSATARITTSGIELSVVIAGVESTDSITFAGNTLISDLATAIIAAGDDWTAESVVSIPAPSTDLLPAGGFGCAGWWATFAIPSTRLSDYTIYKEEGYLRRNVGWLDNERNIMIRYRAGYETIPADLQKVIADEVGMQYKNTERNLTLKSETLGDYKWIAESVAPSDRFEEALVPFLGRRFV